MNTQVDWQGIEISQSYDVAPQELVESLSNHLIVIHTTPQPVEVVERVDSLRFKDLRSCGFDTTVVRRMLRSSLNAIEQYHLAFNKFGSSQSWGARGAK